MKEKPGRKKILEQYVILAIIFAFVSYPITWLFVYFWNIVDALVNGAEVLGEGQHALYAGLLAVAISIVMYLTEHFKSDKQRKIDEQFRRDQTSICPRCGSEDIQIYPKGYDYKLGFWGALVGSKTVPFLAGVGSNTACCRCRSCGKKWETPYDYRHLD